VTVDTAKLKLAPGTETVTRDDAVYLLARGGGVSGKITCDCVGGAGSCKLGIGTTPNGTKAVACFPDSCSKCAIYVQFPSPQVAALALRAAGLALPWDAAVIGDLASVGGAAIVARRLAVRPDKGVVFEQADTGTALLRRKARGGKPIASFSCVCASKGGSCAIKTTQTQASCVSSNCTNCVFEVTVEPRPLVAA
jgi:hypothetical protein